MQYILTEKPYTWAELHDVVNVNKYFTCDLLRLKGAGWKYGYDAIEIQGNSELQQAVWVAHSPAEIGDVPNYREFLEAIWFEMVDDIRLTSRLFKFVAKFHSKNQRCPMLKECAKALHLVPNQILQLITNAQDGWSEIDMIYLPEKADDVSNRIVWLLPTTIKKECEE